MSLRAFEANFVCDAVYGPCVIVCINYTRVKYESGMYSLWFICVNSLKLEQQVSMKAQKSQILYQEIINKYILFLIKHFFWIFTED